MNCQELRKEIEELKAKTAEFDVALAEADETNKGWNKVRAAKQACQELEDGLLGKYLGEFKEHNPELAKWDLGERIKGFEYEYKDRNGNTNKKEAIAKTICQLDNGKVMIGGTDGALYEYDLKTKKFEERIEGFKFEHMDWRGNIVEEETDVNFICQLDNGKVMIGGHGGALYEYNSDAKKDERLSERIEGFGNSDVKSICQLDNGKVLIGGGKGALYEYDTKTKKLDERITGFRDGTGKEAEVYSICQLNNGKVLVGGYCGALYEYDSDAEENERLGKRINKFRDKEGCEESVSSIYQLNNGRVMIGGDGGTLYEYDSDAEENERLGKRIEEFYYHNIKSICQLKNGKVMFCGWGWGELYEVIMPGDSVAGLKQHLKNIAAKKHEQ